MQNILNKKFVDITQQCFALLPQVNFPANNLNFHSRWGWWDWIQAIFLNLFYFIKKIRCIFPIKQKHLAPAAFWGPVLIGHSNPSIFGREGCDGHALAVPVALIKLPFYDISVLIGKICLSSLVTRNTELIPKTFMYI